MKLVDVVAVEDMTSGDHLARELLLIKLQIAAEHVDAVDALLRRVGGKVLSSNPSSYIVELTSTEAEIGEFIANVGRSAKSSKWCAAACSASRAPIRACMSSNNFAT